MSNLPNIMRIYTVQTGLLRGKPCRVSKVEASTPQEAIAKAMEYLSGGDEVWQCTILQVAEKHACLDSCEH